MKQLLFSIAVLALALTAEAQSSNLVQSIRLTFTDEAGATNNTTINLDANEAQGFYLNYAAQTNSAVQATNPVPSFQNTIRQTTRTFLLNPLAAQAQADDRKTNNVNLLWLFGKDFWDSGIFTSQQKQDFKAIANAPNVKTNFPPQ